jgi:hypothetical protein
MKIIKNKERIVEYVLDSCIERNCDECGDIEIEAIIELLTMDVCLCEECYLNLMKRLLLED